MIGLTQQEQVEFERIKDEMWNYGYETAKEEFGWHPASEKSKIKIGETILVLFKSPIRGRLLPWAATYNGELPFGANWWIRFPKED